MLPSQTSRMEPKTNHNNGKQVQQELEALSPMLAQLAKPEVPMPNDAYFANLIDKVVQNEPVQQKPKRTFKLIPLTAASLAVAASIAVAIMLLPSDAVDTNKSFSFDMLSNDELVQLAMQDEALLTDQVLEEDSLLVKLADNTDFQYLDETDTDDEYNRLLWEMVDDETLMEDWL